MSRKPLLSPTQLMVNTGYTAIHATANGYSYFQFQNGYLIMEGTFISDSTFQTSLLADETYLALSFTRGEEQVETFQVIE